MKRKWVIVPLLLAALLSGCKPQTPVEPPAEQLIVVGVSQVGAESDWRVANSESLKAVFTEENGYRLLFEDARQKQENQIAAIRRFIQQQVDYIVLMPLCETGWDSVLQEAKEAGIPVILVDRMADVEDETLFAAHVGSDFRRQGDTAISWLEQENARLGRTKLDIIHIQGTLGSTAQLGRTQALEEAVAAHEDWRLLFQFDGDFTQAKTYEVMGAYLSGPDAPENIDVVYCENDNEAFGAIQALEEAGYTCGDGGVTIISFDAARNGLRYCLEGKISLVVECNPLLGPLAEESVRMLEEGRVPEKHRYIDEQYFTRDALSAELIEQRPY